MANWYYAKSGQQHGPVSESELRRLAEAGQLRQRDLVWKEGMEQWLEAENVPELFAGSPPAQDLPPQPSPQPHLPQPLAYATPPAYAVAGYGSAPPPNYLAQAIIVTMFCCLPFGVPAIVFAAQVNGKWAAGDHRGAAEMSEKAKTWCWVSFGLGLVPALLTLLWFGFIFCIGFGAALA
jgi:hypothetical protein